jgi:aspartyl-tRNA(Asn)/glutamyl-tRNA(Gln) amidotransferase subunit A
MPPGSSDLADLTLTDASELLHRGHVSSQDLVEAALGRLKETEPAVHAFAFVAEDAARQAAWRVDVERGQGYDRGPLHGIPIGAKDLIETRDQPTRAGSRVLSGHAPTQDAHVVIRLIEAGAVIIGKTVTHEFGYGQNPLPTRNAWDTSRFSGGSSAGSAVCVAVRSAYGALGTDSGGSIRGPASMNGVVGLKPTYGRVSRVGVFPMSPSLDQVGPIARTVDDLALLQTAIEDRRSPRSADSDQPSPERPRSDLRGVRLGVYPTFFYADSEVGPVVDTALQDLVGLGAETVEVSMPWLEDAISVGSLILAADASAWHENLLATHGSRYHPGTRAMLEFGQLIPATHYINAQRIRSQLISSMRQAFADHRLDALVGPTLPILSAPIEELAPDILAPGPVKSIADYVHHCLPANVTGQPALTIPCGFAEAGVPVGLQFIGRPNMDEALLDIARVYERLHAWFALRPPVVPAGMRPA